METKQMRNMVIRGLAYTILFISILFLFLTIMTFYNYGTKMFLIDHISIIIAILGVIFFIVGITILVIFPEYIPLNVAEPLPRGTAYHVKPRGESPPEYNPTTDYASRDYYNQYSIVSVDPRFRTFHYRGKIFKR